MKDTMIEAALNSAAKTVSMNNDAAFTVLVSALGAAGLGTDVAFASSASAAAGATAGSTTANTGMGIGIGVTAAAAGVAVYCLGSFSPAIQNIEFNDSLTAESVPVTVSLESSIGISQVYAKDESGIRYEGVRQDDGTYLIEISDNGDYQLTAEADNGKTVTESFTVACIDKSGPEITDYVLKDGMLELTYADTQCGLDVSSAYGQGDDGTIYQPVSADADTGLIIYQYKGEEFSVYLKDTLGNQSVHIVTPK